MPRPRREAPRQQELEPQEETVEVEDVETALRRVTAERDGFLHALDVIRRSVPDERTLDERMAAVQLEIEDVPRRGHADVETRSGAKYSYDYVTEADLMAGVRPLLAKHGIAFYYASEILRYEQGSAHVRVTVTLAAAGDVREFTVDGWSSDFGDKAANKAQTTALRYWLWKTFLQPNDEDDPEQSSVSEEEARRAAATSQARRGGGRSQESRGKLIERIAQLSLELDEVQGNTPGATLKRIPELATEAFGLREAWPNGATDDQLVSVGRQVSEFLATERSSKEADPDAYSARELEIVKR